jgi:hypothetical protein
MIVIAASGALLSVFAFAGCGGGGGGDPVVARVAGSPVKRSEVDHWMNTLAGGDFYELSANHTVPAGLVSDPPDYPRCVRSLKAAAAAAPKKIVKLGAIELLHKCHQLYIALKEQATNYVITARWLVGLNRELGITASRAEVDKLYKKVKAQEFPTAAAQSRFFASQNLSVADELLIVMLDVLRNKDSLRIQGKDGKARYEEIQAAEKRWNSKITCVPTYVVAHCRKYKGGEEQSYHYTPSPAVLMEQVAAISTGRCTNFEACLRE